jgi:hypothetical protein
MNKYVCWFENSGVRKSIDAFQPKEAEVAE